ncbi:MAG: hypothetical protein R3F43_31595 [bacterium]
MPVIAHPYYDPTEPLTMRTPVDGVSVNGGLASGVDAWAYLKGRPKAPPPGVLREQWPWAFDDAGPERLVRFRVQVRGLRPGPELGPRDQQVAEWIDAQGWTLALEAAERRWAELRGSGELVQHAADLRAADAVEYERRRAEDAARPGFADELASQAGELAESAYAGAKAAANAVAEGAASAWGYLKWGLIGTAAVVGLVAAVRLVREVKR